MVFEIFHSRWPNTSLNFYFIDEKLCICVFLFSFTAAKKHLMSKTLKKKPMRFESIYTTLNGNTDQIACKYDTQNWTLFHPIARHFQGKSILIVQLKDEDLS